MLLCLVSPSLASSRKSCQALTKDPLSGCPQGTLMVGPGSEYPTIQSAILSLPHDNSSHTILVLPGNYTEQVNITRPGPVTLLGQTSHPTLDSKNTVNVIWHNATGTASTGSYDNLYTSTLTIAPTQNSSATGSGPDGNPVPANTPFGNTNFRAYNLNFINDYLPYSAGPSLALSVSYANAGFYYCGFYSYQDTVSLSTTQAAETLLMTPRSTLVSWETPISTNQPWLDRPISSMALALSGFSLALCYCALAEVE